MLYSLPTPDMQDVATNSMLKTSHNASTTRSWHNDMGKGTLKIFHGLGSVSLTLSLTVPKLLIIKGFDIYPKY